jgi:hypothetical protein
MDRATASGAVGWGFESLRARQMFSKVPRYARDFGSGFPLPLAALALLTTAKRLKFESLRARQDSPPSFSSISNGVLGSGRALCDSPPFQISDYDPNLVEAYFGG